MGVYIKGLKMPNACDECWALDESGDYPMCRITGETRGYNFRVREKRMDRCPLIELPDHGDLIEKRPIVDTLEVAEKNVSFLQRGVEREENIKYCQGAMVGYANSILAIDNAPVIIPAERREE